MMINETATVKMPRNDYKKTVQASFLIALSGILYGFFGYLGTHLLQENFSLSNMLFWRFLIAGCWMLLFCIKKHSFSRLFTQVDRQTLWVMFFLGAFGYSGASGFFFMASRYTGTGLAMVIFFSYPILVALLMWLTQRKSINSGVLLSLITMTIGLLLLRHSTDHVLNIGGIFFATCASVCYAVYVIGSKRFSLIHVDSTVLAMIVCFSCAAIFLVFALATNTLTMPVLLKSWIYLLLMSIPATALPIQLMLEGMKHVSSMRASIISVLEPLVTVLVGVLLLHESISHLQILGTFIILASALLVQLHRDL